MQADTGKKFHEMPGSLSAFGNRAVAGTPKLVAYRPIFAANIVSVFDVKKRKVLHKIPAHKGLIVAAAVTADGETVVTVDNKGSLHVWNSAKARNVATREVEGKPRALAIDRRGKRAAVGTDGGIRIVDLTPR